jgi:hypothetical protein
LAGQIGGKLWLGKPAQRQGAGQVKMVECAGSNLLVQQAGGRLWLDSQFAL